MLEQLRSYQARQIAAECVEYSEARLQQLQDRAIAAESAEEREVRLQQLRTRELLPNPSKRERAGFS